MITPAVMAVDAVEDDDRHSLAVPGGEGLELYESRHSPGLTFHLIGQVAVAGVGIGAKSGPEHGQDCWRVF